MIHFIVGSVLLVMRTEPKHVSILEGRRAKSERDRERESVCVPVCEQVCVQND